MLLRRLDDRPDRLLDSEVHGREPVVAEDDVDQVLADVMHIAAHRGEHDRALARRVAPLHMRLQMRHRRLHRLRRLEHERQLHLARAEQVAHLLHRRQQQTVDDLQRRALAQRFIEIVVQPLAQTVHDPPVQPLLNAQLGDVALLAPHADALEQRHELDQRILAVAPIVVDQPQRRLALPLVDLVRRQNLRGVNDRRREPALHRLLQEHAVEHLPRRRIEPERNVADPQDRLRTRKAA